ncbi:MAG: TonB-dependent receptor [Muribaculaceae bacterium]|nr:TonB-dependent receptor [Muribaculaceae bacterium]
MKLKLFLLLTLLACLPAWAQTGLKGVVKDAKSGQPVAGVTVLLDNQGITVTTGPNGDFSISGAKAGNDVLLVLSPDHKDWSQNVEILNGTLDNVGTIKVEPVSFNSNDDFTYSNSDIVLTESQLEDEEGNTQAVGTLAGANDNPFYQAASFDFSLMRFRMRGYNSEYTSTSINGINFNDAVRGRFNYSMMGGLNQAFKSKSTGIGLDATSFAFGDMGGATNINTYAKDYAPGFRGSVAFTNGNYKWRGMATYATGLSKDGWALTASAVGRFADEGIVPGSFYQSAGYFLAVQKVFNPQHSLAFTTFGAPTRRASNSATVQECYDLAGTNLYNSNWGYQNGKKRNAKTVESFDPTALINWLWTPSVNTTLNTGVAFHKSFYSSTALNWFNAPDPRPDYYRYLPSYYDGETAEFYTDLWKNHEDMRQINWDKLYYVNYLNNYEAEKKGAEPAAATYSLERRHNNQATFAFNTNLNTRLNDVVTLQGGANAAYTRSSYYKTMADLLGGDHWLDIDQYAERDFPSDPNMAQNDLDNPNRKIYKNDRFGYDYNINSFNAGVWNQMVFNLPQWNFNYSLKASYTSFQRDGKMRNGRAPENSKGKGELHEYINAAVKVGATYKLDGRNNFKLNLYYGNRAPLPNNAYVSPRIKDDVITNLKSENIFSGDLSYTWNYRSFQGVITAFYTDLRNGTERYSYYDDQYSTFMNYALTDVHKVYKGVELGMAYKLTSSLTLSGAMNLARYQYKNRPTGTRSYENGTEADITKTVYLKNFYVSGTPQEAYSVSLNWAAPKMWFFELTGTYMDKAYIDLSPIRHEQMDNLYTMANTEAELIDMMKSISKQEKLNSAFVLGASIGHVIYLNRRSSLNFNLNVDNILNNTKIMTGGYQQGRFDYKNFTTGKFPNKYYYAQGIKVYLNVGIKF